jgi:hypothetical protein
MFLFGGERVLEEKVELRGWNGRVSFFLERKGMLFIS